MNPKNRNRKKRNLKMKPETNENIFIGNRIKKEIYRRGYTQEGFANLIGTTKVSVSEWANGVKLPQCDKWPDIKIYLGIDIISLMICYRKKVIFMFKRFYETSNIEEAKKMASLLVSNADISNDNEIVDSVSWLLTAIIGLNYGKLIMEGYEEPDWYSVRESLESYLNEDNNIVEEFSELSEYLDSDNFEEYEAYREYFEDSLYYWRLFSRAVRKGSTVHDRVLVALSKVVDTM